MADYNDMLAGALDRIPPLPKQPVRLGSVAVLTYFDPGLDMYYVVAATAVRIIDEEGRDEIFLEVGRTLDRHVFEARLAHGPSASTGILAVIGLRGFLPHFPIVNLDDSFTFLDTGSSDYLSTDVRRVGIAVDIRDSYLGNINDNADSHRYGIEVIEREMGEYRMEDALSENGEIVTQSQWGRNMKSLSRDCVFGLHDTVAPWFCAVLQAADVDGNEEFYKLFPGLRGS
jgi:hypothetical protein